MKNFLVLYMMPVAGLEEWAKKSADERKTVEEKMQGEWQEWAKAHKDMLKETAGAGTNQRVTTEGISQVKNDVMMYSMVEAESPEAAAKIFEHHPHLGIPGAWIEIMPANKLPGMGDF